MRCVKTSGKKKETFAKQGASYERLLPVDKSTRLANAGEPLRRLPKRRKKGFLIQPVLFKSVIFLDSIILRKLDQEGGRSHSWRKHTIFRRPKASEEIEYKSEGVGKAPSFHHWATTTPDFSNNLGTYIDRHGRLGPIFLIPAFAGHGGEEKRKEESFLVSKKRKGRENRAKHLQRIGFLPAS